MYQVTSVSNDSYQELSLILPDNSLIQLNLYFVPMQYAWFITNLTYGSFTLTGLRITNSPNILQQFANQLPFGLGCQSLDDREPTQQDDFSSGASVLLVLTADDVASYTSFLNGSQ